MKYGKRKLDYQNNVYICIALFIHILFLNPQIIPHKLWGIIFFVYLKTNLCVYGNI
jgi:hypothetical protein